MAKYSACSRLLLMGMHNYCFLRSVGERGLSGPGRMRTWVMDACGKKQAFIACYLKQCGNKRIDSILVLKILLKPHLFPPELECIKVRNTNLVGYLYLLFSI